MTLPCTPTAAAVIDAYLAQLADKGPKAQAVAAEVAAGIRTYFEHALGTLLLYPQERAQYDELLEAQPDVEVATVYGAAHLLRLFGGELQTAR